MKKYISCIFIAVFFLCSFASTAFAQIIPLRSMSLRLLFTADLQATPRTIQVKPTGNSIRLTWYSLEKEFETDNPYPTYKIKPKKGAVEFDNFDNKVGFFHPRIWGNGFYQLDDLLPLWVDPKYLYMEEGSRESLPYSIQFLNTSKIVLQSAPDEYFEKLGYFQKLYNHFFVDGKINKKLNLKKNEVNDLEKFQDNFFNVSVIAKTNAQLVINGQKRTVPTRIVGNDYFHLIVLGDPQNPLVLAMRLFPENSPQAFQPHFKEFKKYFEFQITQVSY